MEKPNGKKILLSLAAASLLSNAAGHAATSNDACAPVPPATCNAQDCTTCYCLGPENYGVNAPVRPITCNGDWEVTLGGIYWNSHQEGLEYAIETQTRLCTIFAISFIRDPAPREIYFNRVGGEISLAVLPHHRTYGSVYGGS